MSELLLILVATVLVNNFVLVQFLGLCPFVGVSSRVDSALGMSIATGFVLTLSAVVSYLLDTYVLQPLDLGYLRTLSFILIIACMVQLTEIAIRSISPVLHQVLGIYLPLITSNCAVLGIALLNARAQHSFLESLIYGIGVSAGFALVLVLFSSIRERLQEDQIPMPFRGAAITLLTAGIMSLAFMGFGGLWRI